MRLGIMQPYFFPYIGYFSLIKNVDLFILFDPVPFIYHGWIERNRILKQTGGWQYISVPLEKYHRDTIISDIRIRDDHDWRKKIIAQLQHYKKKAPYFWNVIKVVEEGISNDSNSITEMNRSCLNAVCKYLGINTPIRVFSEMNLHIGEVKEPDEWALRICEAMNATDYWNPPGGLAFFDREKYKAAGINISFLNTRIHEYEQWGGKVSLKTFEPSLSIIDVMMNNSVERITDMMEDYELK